LLIAGGIALGKGVSVSGLDVWLTHSLPLEPSYFFPVLALTTMLLSTLISNTAAVNLLIPLGISIVFGFAGDSTYYLKEICIGLAMVASMGMGLPVSTPSNSIAYSQGHLGANDFLKTGGLVGLIGTTIIILVAYLLRYFFQ
jgi:sodium-dependent dicarboxylate transporter 2/3/5